MTGRTSILLVAFALFASVVGPLTPAAADDPATSIDVHAWREALERNEPVTLRLDGTVHTLSLTPADLFAPGYEAREAGVVVPTTALPYAGFVVGEPGSQVRATLLDDGVAGFIALPGQPVRFFEPAHDVQDPRRHIVSEAFETPHDHAAAGGTHAKRGDLVSSHNCPLGLSQLYSTPLCPTHPPANSAPNVPGTPSGPSSRLVGESGTYCATTTDPDGDNIQYVFQWGDGSQSTVDAASGQQGCAGHSWSSTGTYCVNVYAQDLINPVAGTSGCRNVAVTQSGGGNQPPNVPPAPTGPANRNVNEQGTYCTTTTDPDGDNIQYVFQWDDGSQTTVSKASGQEGCAAHSWSSAGSYCITVYAQDLINPVAGTSGCKWVTVATAPPTNHAPTHLQPWGAQYANTLHATPFSTRVDDIDSGDTIRVTFTWGDGAQTFSTWRNPGEFVVADHAYASAGTYTYCARAEDNHGALSTSTCGTIEVATGGSGRMKIQFTAMADQSFKNAFPSTWQNQIASYMNSVNGLYNLANPNVEVVVGATTLMSTFDYTAPSACGTALDQLSVADRQNTAYTEAVQAFVGHTFSSASGCAFQSMYTDSAFFHSIVSAPTTRTAAAIVQTAAHELGHTTYGTHEDAASWTDDGSHHHCTLMWNGNEGSTGPCTHRHDQWSTAEADHIRGGVRDHQGNNQAPREPYYGLASNWGGRLDIDLIANDPDKDPTRFEVAWGDSTWNEYGFANHGSSTVATHQYASGGSYTIWIIAWDHMDASSAQSYVVTV